MSRLQGLKVRIQQRLTAAVEEIFGLVDQTIAECEEEMSVRRRHVLLDLALKPETHTAQEAGACVSLSTAGSVCVVFIEMWLLCVGSFKSHTDVHGDHSRLAQAPGCRDLYPPHLHYPVPPVLEINQNNPQAA